MGSGGGSRGTSTTTEQASIAPELRPLFGQTASFLQNLQAGPGGNLAQFFGANPQQIPGATPGQMDILQRQRSRAFGPMLTGPEGAGLMQLGELTGGPLGSSPATQAAMQAAMGPIQNQLALAGLGRSGALTTDLAGAFAPILAQEQAMRFGSVPQLFGLGNTLTGRQSGLLGELGQSEEAIRGLTETQGAANREDFLRRQALAQSLTTGILGSLPTTGLLGRQSTTRSSGGGIK